MISVLWAVPSELVVGIGNLSAITFVISNDVNWQLWCEMDFTAFPIDKQVSIVLSNIRKKKILHLLLHLQICDYDISGEDKFSLHPMVYTESFERQLGIKLLSNEEHMQLDSLNLDYDATVSIKQSAKHSWALALQLRMKRKIRRSVVEIICPPGLLVMVSWVWLKNL